jgi:hypothetical protein
MQQPEFDPALTFFEKLRVLAACSVAILLLWTLGWQLAHPSDPGMALTLSRSGARVVAVWPALAVLAAISAAVGTAIIGRRLPEAGVLAAGIGLAAMSLRGGTMQALLGYEAGTQTGTRRALMMSLLLDTVLWTGVMAVAWVAMLMVRRWLWSDMAAPVVDAQEVAAASKGAPAKKGSPPSAAGGLKTQAAGYIALGITIVVGLIVIWNTVSRTPVAVVQRNQVIASVAGGLFLGAMAGRYFTGATEPLLYVLAAPAVAIVAFILGHLSSDMSWAQGTIYQPFAALATTPPHDLVRPLPVIYLTVGVAAALGGYWTADRMEKMAQQEST